VALYSKGKKRWTMTERGKRFLHRSSTEFTVGPSQLRWTGHELIIDINEWSVPIPMRVKGQMRIRADQFFNYQQPIDAQSRHRWGPLAPSARIEVDFPLPGLKWSGHAYLDSNEGDEPIEAPFHEWDWSRALMRDGSTAVIYDVRDRAVQANSTENKVSSASSHGSVSSRESSLRAARALEFNQASDAQLRFADNQSSRLITARFRPNGQVEPFELGPRQALPTGIWGVGRSIRSDPKAPTARLVQTLEDTPFYMRSVVSQTLLGEEVHAMHETLFLPRVRSRLVRLMLPWRMPRRT
jgi:carotenoid 1,2-hydratase